MGTKYVDKIITFGELRTGNLYYASNYRRIARELNVEVLRVIFETDIATLTTILFQPN
jgi:hypothetical protein